MTGIRFTGFGGQGIMLIAHIVGKAAALFDDMHVTLTQAYGPEARGGASRAEVIISEDPVDYPYIVLPDIVVAMSQEGFNLYGGNLSPDGAVLIDEDLVEVHDLQGSVRVLSIPATRLAEDLGRKIVANIVMLGFLTKQAGVCSSDSVEEAIRATVPKGTDVLNLKAFRTGFNYKP